MSISNEVIPNNIGLSEDRRLQRALVHWQPRFLDWWKEMGPAGFNDHHSIYLRTAVGSDSEGWAHFDHVRMPEYRWGIFFADKVPGRSVGFGDAMGEDVWNEVPGEYRNYLRRLIITQGDTEPASVEQQRMLGQTCPSLYDLRNLFQVNVEEGRHLWAMVHLLHSYFGRDGREEAEAMLERRSGDVDKPRILGAFNEPMVGWLDFYMFTTFTDRDGKYQLLSLSESAFDPLSRATHFMLREEAHHMFVGETGVRRVVERTCDLMQQDQDVRRVGGIDLGLIQKHINQWFSVSVDLFGGEVSSNAASYFANGLKGRPHEDRFEDHRALEGVYHLEMPTGDGLTTEEVPLRNAMNEVSRDGYAEECSRSVGRWNKVLEERGMSERLYLPHRRFNRNMGVYADHHFDPQGQPITKDEWDRRRDEWLPTADDHAYIKSVMSEPIFQAGQMANWIAAPAKGINGKPIDFEYVRTEG